jgi:magnesium chelatase family protein
MLVATKNPCPCGYFGDIKKECECSQAAIDSYQKKLSGPLIDRIDMSVTVERVAHRKLMMHSDAAESSAEIQKRVTSSKQIQFNRQSSSNSRLSSKNLKKYANLTNAASEILLSAAEKLNLSSRGYMRTLKVSRTIADLCNSVAIREEHVLEALQYRHEHK